MGYKLFLTVVFLFILLFAWGNYYNPENYSDYDEENETVYLDYIEDSETRTYGKSNPDFLYWKEMPVSYKFTKIYPCEGARKDRVVQAFNIIQQETEDIIQFVEASEKGDILINCLPTRETQEASAYGGPEFYEDGEIIGGEIHLFAHDGSKFLQCESYPVTEVHEILHVFGFDHFLSQESIMHSGVYEEIYFEWEESDETSDCTKIDQEIIECLKNIYSNGINGTICEGLPSLK